MSTHARKNASTQERADNTRSAILCSAIQLFAEHDFASVSNRQLATAADINQALIGYHFGSKSGLYLAVFEHIASDLGQQLQQQIASLEERIRRLQAALATKDSSIAPASIREQSCTAITQLVLAYANILLSHQAENYAKLIIREQLSPSPAFEILWQQGLKRFISTLTTLITLSDSRTESTETDKITAFTLIGQVLVFRVARAAVNCHMEWSEPHTVSSREHIKSIVKANITAMLAKRENPSPTGFR